MSTALRLAVVGVGRMGGFHARKLSSVDGIHVAAVVDNSPGLADAVGRDIGAEVLPSPAALLQRDDIEAWLIATPTPTHPKLVEMALGGGRHVLCEKPLALDVARSEALGLLAASSGRVLQMGFWRRFSPPWVTAKRLLDNGTIGRPVMLRLAQWDADPPPAAFCDPQVSGGLAIDCGVHEFDLAEWLTGVAIERVMAHNLRIVEPSVGEAGDVDNLVAVLELPGGVLATVDLSRNCRFGDDVRTEILGDDGAILVDLLPYGRTRLATASGIEVVEGSQTDDAVAAGVAAQAIAFAAAVRGGAVEVPGASSSSRAVAVGRAVQEAADLGTPVLVTA